MGEQKDFFRRGRKDSERSGVQDRNLYERVASLNIFVCKYFPKMPWSQKRTTFWEMLKFEIEGIPVPQKQTRFVRKTGRAYNPSEKEANAVRRAVMRHFTDYVIPPPICGAISMHLFFYMPFTKSASNKKQVQMEDGIILHTKKPDLDNLAYLVTNALKKLVYAEIG